MSIASNAPENGTTLIDSINLANSERVNMVNVFSTFTLEGNKFPMLDMLNNNKAYLLEMTTTVAIPKSEFFKPEYTSARLYGTSSLWYLILFLNEMYSAMDYTSKTIKVLSPNSLNTFISFVNNFKREDYTFEDLTITVIPEGE